MGKGLYWWGILMVAAIQFSCDGFTKKIDVDYSDYVTKGVIIGVLFNTDIRDSAFKDAYDYSSQLKGPHTNRIFISHSNPPGGWREDFYKAHVHLESDNGPLPLSYVDLDEDQFNYKAYYGVEENLIPGKIYYFSAAYDPDGAPMYIQEWAPVSASDTMPDKISFSVENTQFEYSDGNNNRSPRGGYFDLKIEDEPDRTNVYQIEVSAIVELDIGKNQVPTVLYGRTERPDKVTDLDLFETSRDDLYQEDDFTKDGRKRIHFRFNANYDSFDRDKPVLLLVRISNLSDNYIRFQRSSQQYSINKGNPFAEPAEVFTNVDNGYGIFALAARSYVEVEVK